jgi:putative inorganic carbon (hco3(-)) transporter
MTLFYILIFLMPLENHPLWSQKVAGLTLFKYMGLACFLYAVFHLVERQAPPAFFRIWPSRSFLVLVAIASLSYFTKSLTALGFDPLMSYVSFLLLFFITLSVVDSLNRLHCVLMAYIGSVALASLYVIREWQKSGFGESRPGWIVGDANGFGVIASLCLPLVFCLMLERRRMWERLFYAGSLFVTVVGVIASASRGGFLGLLAGVLCVVLKSRRRVRNLILASITILPASLLLPSSPVRRLLHPSWTDILAVNSRTAAWKGGMAMIVSHPLLGVGLGNFKLLVMQYENGEFMVQTVAHNTYLEIAAELGIPALVIFLTLFLSSYLCLEKVRRQAVKSRIRFLEVAARGIECGLVGYLVSGFFVSSEHEKGFWLLIFVSMCLPRLVKSAAQKQKMTHVLVHPAPVEA